MFSGAGVSDGRARGRKWLIHMARRRWGRSRGGGPDREPDRAG